MSYLGRSAKLSLKAQEKISFLATAGQTVKTGLSYTPSFIEVYVNGVLLTDNSDFTATNGNSVTFTVALLLNDEVTVISLKTFTVADHYTKSDADTLLAAKAPLASPVFTGNVSHGDNVKAKFGTGNDGFVYSDGTNILVEGQNTDSEVRLLSDDRVVIGSKAWGESFAIFNDDGAVSLYYDGGVKIATTATGVAVTGGISLGGTGAANTISDYETGTWTPSGTGINTGTSVGYYTKVGNVCHLQMWVHANGNTNGTISGLPFTAGHANSAIAVGTIGFINGSVTGILSAGQNTSITMYNGTGTGTMASGNQMHCAMTYRTT